MSSHKEGIREIPVAAQHSVPHEHRDDMQRTAGTLRVFGAGSERWQFSVSQVGSPTHQRVTQAVGRQPQKLVQVITFGCPVIIKSVCFRK